MRDNARTPVESNRVTASGDVVAQGTAVYVLSVHYLDTAVAGTVELLSGGSGGDSRVTLDAPGNSAAEDVPFPEPGMYFADGCYANLTGVDGLTVFCREA